MKQYLQGLIALTALAAPALAGEQSARLSQVETWMYQLQRLEEPQAVAELAATGYDMLVIETGDTLADSGYGLIDLEPHLRQKPDGGKRLLVAYIDIGQAEDYRSYWADDWQAPTATQRGYPDFILTLDPDGWPGNYPVAYWDSRWQALWTGPDGIVADLAHKGIDGVYLDWVGAYEDEGVLAAAEAANIDPAAAMLDFIGKIRTAGQIINPDFFVIAQNAPYLIDEAPQDYVSVVDALAVEDTWFRGTADEDWNSPDAGDIRNTYSGAYSTQGLLQQYAKVRAKGLPVFSVDYCVRKANADLIYATASAYQLIPLVTRVPLSHLTETPPPPSNN